MSPSDPPIDWTALARELGTLRDGGEIGGSDLPRAALTRLLGPRQIVHAVDHYVEEERGFELARTVVWSLRPEEAMHECRRIDLEDADLARRQNAVALLRDVATREALAWVVWCRLLRPEDDPTGVALLARADAHPNEGVRDRASFIRNVLAHQRDPRG